MMIRRAIQQSERVRRLGALAAYAPHVYTALVRAQQAAREQVDPSFYEVVRRTVEAEHRLGPDVETTAGTPADAVSELARQFVVYVPGVTDELLVPVRRHMDEEALRALVETMYIVDQTSRLTISHAILFDPDGFPLPQDVDVDGLPNLTEAVEEYHHSVLELRGLDVLTTEMVRLRCAQYHHCRDCACVRFGVNGQAVASDSLVDKISRYEASDLEERHKVALRYADSYMMFPREVDVHLRDYFDESQILQLSLQVTAWNRQKIRVALGTDDARPEDERLVDMGKYFEVLPA